MKTILVLALIVIGLTIAGGVIWNALRALMVLIDTNDVAAAAFCAAIILVLAATARK